MLGELYPMPEVSRRDAARVDSGSQHSETRTLLCGGLRLFRVRSNDRA